MRMKSDLEGNDSLYNPFDAMSFTYDRCFLCGCLLKDKKSVEHIFPKWLQNRYGLWNQKIHLLNRTEIPYRRLTIPCCHTCNIECLSPIENTVRLHHERGYLEFLKLDKIIVFQWIAKMFYGLLFKELSLLVDRSDPNYGFITSPELLKELRTLHTFLQSVRVPFEFAGFHPWSIFLLEIHTYGDARDFDYHDEIFTLTFSIRMGEIGIIACLEDNGAQEELFSDYFDQFKGIRLHPTQFDELVAKVAYKASLMNRTPKYVMITPEGEGQKVTVVSPSLQGFSNAPIFDDWNQRDYAKFLLYKWSKYGMQFEDIFREPDMVLSLLFKEDGIINVLDADGNPADSHNT